MDIDLDFPADFDPLKIFPQWTKASMTQNQKQMPHPCGVYPQEIPKDPMSGLAAIPYKEAEDLGYFKIDFLTNHVYDHFSSREEIDTLLEIDPPWELMKSPSVVKQLFQLSKHFDTVQRMNPTSVEELADVLAIIRPGKKYLIDKYREDKEVARQYLFEVDKNAENYGFKKAHAIAYALVIVLQLHLISAGVDFEN